MFTSHPQYYSSLSTHGSIVLTHSNVLPKVMRKNKLALQCLPGTKHPHGVYVSSKNTPPSDVTNYIFGGDNSSQHASDLFASRAA